MTDMTRSGPVLVLALTLLSGTADTSAQPSAARQSAPGQPTRDTPARQAAEPTTPKGRIAGRVVAADTGRPVRRARVFLSGAAVPGGRGALTDDEGRFELTDLAEGRYSLTAGKTGFITLSFGQRRPLQAGTPIQLADGQQLTSVDFSLPRGSVIAGHVYDDAGDPLPGASVRVMRYEYAQGNRQLVPVGAAQSDDLGAYRVWGLNPGEYYVSAVTPATGFGGRGGPAGAPGFAPGGRGGGGRGGGPVGAGAFAPPGGQADPAQLGYAPTFYPGVPSASEARPVTVGLSMEIPSIDFAILLVRTARISGRVTNPDGTATTAGNIVLVPETGGRPGRGGASGTIASRIDWDGSFSIAGVAPGRYVLRARSDDTVEPQFALQPITVADTDLTNLTVVLAEAASISGSVSFQGTQGQQAPDPGQVRVAAPLVDQTDLGPNPTARVERSGTFTLSGVQAGTHLFRAQGSPRGWILKSVTVNGRDVIDTPVELRSGQRLGGVTMVFTDRLTEVSGAITDDRGAPVTEYTILAFPVDERLWGAQSRHIMTTRPDQNGRYQLRGLPPADYLLVAVDPAEQGEWFEPAYLAAHRNTARRVSLAEGEVKTQDFAISSR
ncbi:MAG TPA: carboxypeptidase-like regulatory domain-containing protein [Vicinamibacterales bacterium]|nr:carboxypeptidase-like regulatory domain-containing protein [Vicinamibacterales bacterium]